MLLNLRHTHVGASPGGGATLATPRSPVALGGLHR